jgi:hypothetical protein
MRRADLHGAGAVEIAPMRTGRPYLYVSRGSAEAPKLRRTMQPHARPRQRLDGWEQYPHDADVGSRGYGTTCAIAFEQAAQAMAAIVVDPRSVAASETHEPNGLWLAQCVVDV